MSGGNCYSRRTGAKRPFYNKDEAQSHKAYLENKYKIKYEVYLCKYCGAWHVGGKK